MVFLLCEPGWCVHMLTERCSRTTRRNGMTTNKTFVAYNKKRSHGSKKRERFNLPIFVLQFLPPFAPEFLVSRGGFGSPTPRWLAHLKASLNLFNVSKFWKGNFPELVNLEGKYSRFLEKFESRSIIDELLQQLRWRFGNTKPRFRYITVATAW